MTRPPLMYCGCKIYLYETERSKPLEVVRAIDIGLKVTYWS